MTTRPWPLLPSDGVTLHHVSDTHFGYRPWSYAEGDHMLADLQHGLIDQVAAFVHTGDIVDGPELTVADPYAQSWLPAAANGKPSIWAIGNHDLHLRSTHSRAAWETSYGRSGNTFIDVDGYRIITFAVDVFNDGDLWTVPAATWSWLAATIESASGPVILAEHFPPDELLNWPANSLQPSATFANIIGDHPQVVGMLCGHMHWEINDTRAARFVTIAGRSIPVLTDVSSMLSISGDSRDMSGQFQSLSAYVTLYEDRWEVRYRAHGTHAWSGPGGQRVTTLDLVAGTVSRGM